MPVIPDFDAFPECELLQQVALSNEDAFRQLFTTYNHQLGTYIFRLTDSMELSEEIVQDVFLKIWENRETLTGVRNFKAYLFVVSKNHALNCLRKLINERAYQQEWEESSINGFTITEEEKADRYYGLLDEAIDHLPPQQQKVYLLSRHEHLKYAEIAKQLSLSRETVKKYLQIAIASITTHVHANMDKTMILFALLLLF
ncbi:RNA polymerase sigma-70 factor [Mucilaginibacter sp. L196]|uniref:RNA polymerase sigma-70 factor n=1 Tax=Mucilaginibacter sp. L196 TaxID=1641870 RepID=UPI00131BEA8E|nr:RNA polymerase sigma-70 factor [Mucilaginibacter sp. L196]